jgi:hypothetical protein
MPSITLNLTNTQAARIGDALTVSLADEDQPATVADVKAYLITKLKQLVKSHEKDLMIVAAREAATDLEIT